VDALLEQTYTVEKVIVVDNNSNKENSAIIKGILDERIFVLHLDENLGGAGGFQKGMEYARDTYNPDWYWLMDADAYPCKDCLEKLLSHRNDKANIGYLAPLIYGIDLQQYQLYHHKKLAKYLERDIPLYHDYSEIPDVSDIIADAFVGPLFSKAAVKEVGIADGSLFIYGDDLEYTFRVTRKFPALLVKNAVINHRDQPAANGVQQPKNWWKDYYMYRNRLLFINKFQENIFKRSIGVFLVWLRVFKQIVLNIKRNKGEMRKLRARLLWEAYYDGQNMKTGKTIDPGEFQAELDKI
jgi:GT2 family glycosyltransferase